MTSRRGEDDAGYETVLTEGKHGGEEGVEELQNEGDRVWLSVMFNGHHQHIEEDHGENGDLEPMNEWTRIGWRASAYLLDMAMS